MQGLKLKYLRLCVIDQNFKQCSLFEFKSLCKIRGFKLN